MQTLDAVLHLAVDFHHRGHIAIGDGGLILGRRPFYRIEDYLLDFRLMVDGENLVAGTEVKDLALAPMIAAPAAEYFAAFKPTDEHQLVGLRDIEMLALHLFMVDDDFFIQSFRNGMAGVDHP